MQSSNRKMKITITFSENNKVELLANFVHNPNDYGNGTYITFTNVDETPNLAYPSVDIRYDKSYEEGKEDEMLLKWAKNKFQWDKVKSTSFEHIATDKNNKSDRTTERD